MEYSYDDYDGYYEDYCGPVRPRREKSRRVECSHCGVGGLEWVEDDGWKLYTTKGERHICDPARVARSLAGAFDVLPG